VSVVVANATSSGAYLSRPRGVPAAPGPVRLGPFSRAVFALALAIAVLLRVWQIEIRPLHHDEGVNWVLLRLLHDHGTYVFDPRNYHGPTLYYLALPILSFIGDTELALRGGPALAGVLTVAVLWSLRRWLGEVGTPTTALCVAVSPGLAYFSRDFIHETVFGLFTLCVVAGVWRYAVARRPGDLVMTGVAAGLLFATKETAVIVAVVLVGAFVISLAIPCGSNDREGRVIRWRVVPAEVRDAVPVAHSLLAIGSFTLVLLVLYSAFFTRWEGIIDAARAPFLWVRAGVSEQTRPWHYYLGILLKLELPLVVGGVLGGIVALRRRTRFGVFVTAWAIGIGLAYSVIPYKMPWLIVSLLLPLAILSGLGAEAVASTVKAQPLRILAALGTLAMLGWSGWIAYSVSFVRYDDPRNTTGYFTTLGVALRLPAYRRAEYGGYVFSQTDRDLLKLVDAIDQTSDRWSTRQGTRIYVTSPDLQPLPWYLRRYTWVAYGADLGRVVPHSIIVASTGQRAEIERLPGVATTISRFRLRPAIDLLLGVYE
jgi:uncharacterized protein (TIGR03663 family)